VTVPDRTRKCRLEDPGVALILVDDAARAQGDGSVSSPSVSAKALLQRFPPIELSRTALLIDLPGDEVLLLPGADAQILPRGDGEEDLRRRASSAATAFLRERHRLQRRIQVPDWLMGYVDELQRAATAADVHLALLACTMHAASTFTAVAYVPGKNGTAGMLEPLQQLGDEAALPALPRAATARFTALCVMTEVEARDNAGRSHALAPVFAAFGAAQLVCLPVGADAVHILVERRRERVFTAEDRDMLDWVVRQAERALAALSFPGGAPVWRDTVIDGRSPSDKCDG